MKNTYKIFRESVKDGGKPTIWLFTPALGGIPHAAVKKQAVCIMVAQL